MNSLIIIKSIFYKIWLIIIILNITNILNNTIKLVCQHKKYCK
jgi:hypothetical protein